MRFVVYGVGAIGGVVAAALANSGADVIGIARGAQLEAIRKGGLRLRAPGHDFIGRFPCVGDPAEITPDPDDIVLLVMKSQDTAVALDRLVAAGFSDQPVFCVQNGIANERMALRRFANVHGVNVMMPGTFLTPGEVSANCGPRFGVFDLGRYPSGSDRDDHKLAEALDKANIAAFVQDDVMVAKRGKLLLNLNNVTQAALGQGMDQGRIPDALRSEAVQVFEAAGLAWQDDVAIDPRRRDLMRMDETNGPKRSGGSTLQSLLRKTGSLETDFMNGEIVLLGRLNGVPTPVNARAQSVGAKLARDSKAPGSMTLDELEALLLDL